jgi:hypothetical protein
VLQTNTDRSRFLAQAINKISQSSKVRLLPPKLKNIDSTMYWITKQKALFGAVELKECL